MLRGTVVTGALQGIRAAIGYAMTGLPDPIFFGALTVVWVRVEIYMLATGHSASGVAERVYAALIVEFVPDCVIWPKLVGSEKGVPAVFAFVSLFGGVEVFGFIGLIHGPVVVTMAVAVLRTYDSELRASRGT